MIKKYLFLFFVVLTVWAYWPSLQHAPKHDQLGFLADMALRHTVWDKTVGAISWNRERLFMGPDPFLFRPLLHCWLLLQLKVFGYNFTLWQGAAILAHLLVGFSMYRLLSAIRPGMPAAVGAGLFLLMISNVPMVVWHNVSAYMIFCVLLLESLLRWWRCRVDVTDQRSLWQCVIFLIGACLFFDAGVIFCICLVYISVFIKRPWNESRLYLIPVYIYSTLSLISFLLINPVVKAEASGIFSRLLSWDTLINVFISLKWFVATGIFLKASEVIPVERVAVSPLTLDPHWPFVVFSEHTIRGVILIVLFLWGGWFSYSRLIPARRQLMGLLTLMIAAYILFICFGRVNTRGIITGLFFNSYYIYFFWVLTLPAAYAALSLDALRVHPSGRMIKVAVYLLCGVFLFINTLSVHNVNRIIARADHPRRSFIDSISGFVKAHESENDLTFHVSKDCPGNYAGKWLRRPTDPLWRRYTLSEALFPEYYLSHRVAKYSLYCTENPSGTIKAVSQ